MLEYQLWPITQISGSTRSEWILGTNVTVDVSEPDDIPSEPSVDIQTADGADWIAVEYLDTTVFDQGSGRYFVLFNYRIVIEPYAGNLAYGAYSGSITFSNPGWSQSIPVSLTVPSGIEVTTPASQVLYLDEGDEVEIYYADLFPLPYTITMWNPMYRLTTSPPSFEISDEVGYVYLTVQVPYPPLTGGPQYLYFIGQDGATRSIQVLPTRPPVQTTP